VNGEKDVGGSSFTLHISLFTLVHQGTPPPKEKMNFHEQPSDPLGRLGRLYGSDGCPRQRIWNISGWPNRIQKPFCGRMLSRFLDFLHDQG
jgi:hypothetical protein